MAVINKEIASQLERIKKNINTSYMYFNDNVKRFREFKNYIFKESINTQQRTVLQSINRAIVECNILEAFLSRLLGEFSKHEPSVEVSPSEGVPVAQETLDVVEGHIRQAMHRANKDGFAYRIYKDSLGGGFSVGKVWTDYSGPMSMKQDIFWGRVFDPTMVGFDPLARAPHKGDGQYSFEVYPMTREDFLREHPGLEISNIGYTRDIEGFNWSYKDAQDNKIIIFKFHLPKNTKFNTLFFTTINCF